MTNTQAQPAEGQPPLFLSFAIALPVLDAIGWMGCALNQSPSQIPARPDLGAPVLIYSAAASVLLGLLCCIFSLVRRESLRPLGFICLIAYVVPVALAISNMAHLH